MTFKLDKLDHVAITVRDVGRSVKWYQDVLGLRRAHADQWGGIPSFVVAGDTGLALFPAKGAGSQAPSGPGARRVDHIAFRASRENFDRARTELGAKGVTFTFQDHGISHSIYFRDPDGHKLEITTYEV